MIIPWLRGFCNWQIAPLTWAMILTNIIIFIFTQDLARSPNSFGTSRDMLITGRLYQQYLGDDLEEKTEDQYILLGATGLRDPMFLGKALDLPLSGDEVAIAQWRVNASKFLEEFHNRSSYKFGLSTEGYRPLTWLTYQFMHAGWMHIFSNMLLFLIFGAALEVLVGSQLLVLIYLLSGIAGGIGFQYLGGHSLAPMVGASGALSGVMAAYSVLEKKRRVAFFYFLSPIRGYYGLIYLPTLLIFPLCFVADLAGYLATPPGMGGVAFTAHIGGAVFGTIFGLVLRLGQNHGVKYFQSRSGAQ